MSERIMPRKFNEKMLRELSENGYPVDFDSLYAPFNLTIFPVISIEVEDDLLTKFSQNIRKEVRKSKHEFEISDIFISIRILNPEVNATKEGASWSNAERAYKVRRNIDIVEWGQARPATRKLLLSKCVLDFISTIPSSRFSDASKMEITQIVNNAVRMR